MSKALNQSDISHKAERWAKVRRELDELEIKRDDALEAAMAAVNKKYDKRIDALTTKVDTLYDEVVAWLKTRKKSVTVETKNAIAMLLAGVRSGNREPDPQKFIAACKKRKVDPWPAVNVVIARAEPILGKNEFDKVCTTKQVPYADVSLKLK